MLLMLFITLLLFIQQSEQYNTIQYIKYFRTCSKVITLINISAAPHLALKPWCCCCCCGCCGCCCCCCFLLHDLFSQNNLFDCISVANNVLYWTPRLTNGARLYLLTGLSLLIVYHCYNNPITTQSDSPRRERFPTSDLHIGWSNLPNLATHYSNNQINLPLYL